VPVVTTAQLAETVHMLEVFARFLANAWKPLEIMSEFQRVRERELDRGGFGWCACIEDAAVIKKILTHRECDAVRGYYEE
jgi:hypothetical protein